MNVKPMADLQGKHCILIGAGGHAKVVQELAEVCGATILGVCDPKFEAKGEQHWNGLKVLGGDEHLSYQDSESVFLLNGIGMLPGSGLRRDVFNRFAAMGFFFPPLIHPAAWVSSHALVDQGAQIMAGAVIQPGANIGINTIVNTCSSVDHDSQVGSHCHLAPGATLCGDLRVGDGSFIGAGATIIQAVNVAASKMVKAGALVTRDVL
ncbi:acetyltransferase [Marinobacter sp. V034]|uniref:acetyltransferase n=1 Tax=Marinobacter sp. V034 TaxID=3459610 RepID=UPI0040447631